MQFTIEFKNNVSPEIGRMVNYKIPKFKEILKLIGQHVKQATQLNLSGKVLHRRTGNLWRSIKFKVITDAAGWELAVGSYGIVYARIHELGGWAGAGHRSKIPKRPYLRRAFVERKQVIRQLIGHFIKTDLLGG